jgi:hypothetical protein
MIEFLTWLVDVILQTFGTTGLLGWLGSIVEVWT